MILPTGNIYLSAAFSASEPAVSAKGQNSTRIFYHEHLQIATDFTQNKPAVLCFCHKTAGLSFLCYLCI